MRAATTRLLRRSGADWKDLLCVLILVLVCLQLRLPALDRIALNPDESQYEAAASYLQATGRSAFAIQHAPNGTYFFFRLMSDLFGPYPMFEVRILVLIIVLATALLLYAMLRRKSSWWAGLAGGLLFLHLNLFYEGHSANREWFAGLLLVLAVLLCSLWELLPERRRWYLLFLSGLASGLAIFFKLQAAPLLLVVPAFLFWRLLFDRRRQDSVLALLACAAGSAVGLSIYLAGFASAGSLVQFLESIVKDWNVYTMGNVAELPAQSSAAAGVYFERLYLQLPFRPLWLTAFGMSVLCIAATTWGAVRQPEKPFLLADRTSLLMATYHIAALATVSLGQRFFDHYYLFLIFPAAWWAGFTIYTFVTAGSEDRRLRVLAGSWILLILIDRIFALKLYSPSKLVTMGAESWVTILYTAIFIGLLFFWLVRPWQRVTLAAAGLICLEIGLVLLQGQLLPIPNSLPYHRQGYPALVRYLDQQGEDDDRLFVWGWAPEIYSLTRLEAASIYSVCQYVVNDTTEGRTRPQLNQEQADRLMRDLRQRRPRFIVEASRRSWTMVRSGDPWIYDLHLYSGFELVSMLQAEYRQVGSFDDCMLYERHLQEIQ